MSKYIRAITSLTHPSLASREMGHTSNVNKGLVRRFGPRQTICGAKVLQVFYCQRKTVLSEAGLNFHTFADSSAARRNNGCPSTALAETTEPVESALTSTTMLPLTFAAAAIGGYFGVLGEITDSFSSACTTLAEDKESRLTESSKETIMSVRYIP
jgi:hypothetical protein